MTRHLLLALALLLLPACGSDSTTTRSDASTSIDGAGSVDLRPEGRYAISAAPGSLVGCSSEFLAFAESPVGTDLAGLVVNLTRSGTDSLSFSLEGTMNLALSLSASESGIEWVAMLLRDKSRSGCQLTQTLTLKVTGDGSDPIRLDVTEEWRNNPLTGCPYPLFTCRDTLAGWGWKT